MKESLESYVARELHIREADIFGDTRDGEFVKARQICMAMLREFTDKSLLVIGRRYGRDHATVNHAVKSCKRFYGLESDYRALAIKVRAAINDGLIYLPFVDIEPMYEECYTELQG